MRDERNGGGPMVRLASLLCHALVGGDTKLLEQPLRRRLFSLIRRQPGIHASELCRASGEAWGTVQYHLGLLRKGSLVHTHEAGRERRFFPPDMDPLKANLLSLLQQGRREEIAQFIQTHPGIRQVDICNGIGVSRKTFRASIQPLVEQGLVEERRGLQTNRYFPDDSLAAALGDAAPGAPPSPPTPADPSVA